MNNKNYGGKRKNERDEECEKLNEELLRYIDNPDWKEFLNNFEEGKRYGGELLNCWGLKGKRTQFRKFFDIVADMYDKRKKIREGELSKTLLQLYILAEDAVARKYAKPAFPKFIRSAAEKILSSTDREKKIENFYMIMQSFAATIKE